MGLWGEEACEYMSACACWLHTFVKETKCGHVGSISLLEEEEFSLHRDDFYVFMAACDKKVHFSARKRASTNYHFTSWTGSFLGMMSSMYSANGGYNSSSFALTPRTALDLAWLKLETSVEDSNLVHTRHMSHTAQFPYFLNMVTSASGAQARLGNGLHSYKLATRKRELESRPICKQLIGVNYSLIS